VKYPFNAAELLSYSFFYVYYLVFLICFEGVVDYYFTYLVCNVVA